MISTLLLGALLLKLAFQLFKTASDLWLTSHVFRFQQTTTIHKLFGKYGPVVRVSPDKVAFCDADTMRDSYSVQKCEKSSHYKLFTMLTLLDNASHSARRRVFGSHYTAANVARLQPEIHNSALELVKSLELTAAARPVDCLDLLRNFVVDIAVFSTFGHNLGALGKWTTNVPDDLSVAIADFPKMGIVFVAKRIHEVQHQIDTGKEFEIPPLVSRMLQYRQPSTNDALPFEVLVAEGVAHLVAGTETTSTTLSYFLWEISCSSDMMQRLQKEIDTAMPDPRTIPDLSVQNLPYLNAFISEWFRVHGVITGLMERVVPATRNYNLMGYVLPPGTVVGTQSWSIQNSPRVFPSPNRFDPDRWLDGSESGSAERAAHMMPFGLGTRVCTGQQLAQAVIRVALVALVRNFDIRADSSTTKASMRMRHGFAAFPTAGECKLIFFPRTE
ncbi:cytochrome P450 11B1 [Mycena rosella]|uniref:Cytochrome P450 11B1 n=1 Tax=Mycena rosella TaxID=1033263 RepID=A0AAD7D6R3_MYCRO|nr:cytochrome P450 11B1 [Mycena rosella]